MQTFKQAHSHILSFFKEAGWTIKTGLKVPHVTSPDCKIRVWLKTQSLHGNDKGTEPKFENTHSWVSDIRDHEHDDLNTFMRFIDFCANQE